MPAALVVIAKAPVAGRAKTRLSPPCSHEQAASLALAALEDTLAAVRAVRVPRRLLALEGEPGVWLPDGFDVVAQRGGGLDERLAGAFADLDGPGLLVGMDTPQVTPRLLEAGLAALDRDGVDAVLGPARDGGYWAIGLRRPDSRVFLGVPMSSDATGAEQRRRLTELGLRVAELPRLADVDTFAEAQAVAREAPETRFAGAVAAVERELGG